MGSNADYSDEAQFAIMRLEMLEGARVLNSHPWYSEGDRWAELVFSLLNELTPLTEAEVRWITLALSRAGMLEVADLAAARSSDGSTDTDAPLIRRIVQLLVDAGCTPEQAKNAASATVEVASGLESNFAGKVQLYLRSYGELMLSELAQHFPLNTLSQASAQQAFTYWLQNALYMPISLIDDSLKRFCEEESIEPHGAVQAADQLNVNVAYLDDLVQLREAAARQESQQEGAD